MTEQTISQGTMTEIPVPEVGAEASQSNQFIVAIAGDHAGFEQKSQLLEFLNQLGYETIDLGPDDESRVDYPDFANKVALAVASGEADFGVLVCGTGIGMAIAANKTPGIRAANVITAQMAALAREHNDANVLTLSGRFVELDINKEILTTFLNTAFGGGRHSQRVDKINALD